MSLSRVLLACFVALVFVGCTARSGPVRAPRAAQTRSIYLVNNNWHTGIAVPAAEARRSWPVEGYGDADFLQAAWGNNRYYRAQKTNAWMAVQAAFPSESALQVVGIKGSPMAFFRHDEVLEMRVSPEELGRLCAFIGATFQRDGQGRAIYLGPGVAGPTSRFYGALGHYSMCTTCNSWTARALQAAGIPVRSAIRAEGVARQARPFAVAAQRRRR
jgi:uncharacterized protein (TIGR02117 family)